MQFRFGWIALLSLLTACGARVSSSNPDESPGDTASAESAVEDAPEVSAIDVEIPSEEASVEPDASEPEASMSDPDAPLPVSGPNYSRSGPLMARALARTTTMLPSSTGCSGQQCRVDLDVSLPVGTAPGREGPWPVIVFSNGFQVDDAQYQSYALRLATWGYAVVRWNTTNESAFAAISHDVLGRMVRALTDFLGTENTRMNSPLQNQLATARVLLAGHSRGGKISTLAAVEDPRVAGLFLIDPVDAPPPIGAPPPSAVDALRRATRAIPLATVGASDGAMGLMACAPTMHNYTRFYDAAQSPAFEAVAANAGHMDFLDNRSTCGIACLACPDGRTADEQVRALTQTLFVAWAERTLRNADIRPYTEGAWIMGMRGSNLVASFRNK